MPTTKSKKTANKPAVVEQPVAKKTDTPATAPERQSQFATILIGLLIIASGLLVYNYFQSVNSPSTTTNDQVKSTATPTVTPTPTPTPVATNHNTQPTEGSYTVQTGDSLWSVAEKVYGDGFQWDKIAQANQLQKDSLGRPVIEVGQVLTVPGSAASTGRQVAGANTLQQTPDTAIQVYTVQHGDSLWSIAQSVYGHGDMWTLIFNDPHNHIGTLTNGRPLIHAGNQLYIPDAP